MNDTDIRTLNSLIKVCIDGEKGFTAAADDVREERVRAALRDGAAHCRGAAKELQLLVRRSGCEPDTSGSMLGAAHRGWLEVKAGLTGHSDEAVLAACKRGEQAAREKYREVLEQIGISPEVRVVVARQYEGVVINLDKVRRLWSSYAKIPP